MKRNAVETIMGAVVLVVAAVFLYFAYSSAGIRPLSGYVLTASFDRVDGLRDGGDIRLSGIKVGSIISQTLDPKTFLAVVKMSINPEIKLPVDTIALITSTGLLGDEYMSLVPGNEDEMIKPGGVIEHTQPPMNIGSLIGQYIYGQGSTKKGDAPAATPPAPAATPAPAK